MLPVIYHQEMNSFSIWLYYKASPSCQSMPPVGLKLHDNSINRYAKNNNNDDNYKKYLPGESFHLLQEFDVSFVLWKQITEIALSGATDLLSSYCVCSAVPNPAAILRTFEYLWPCRKLLTSEFILWGRSSKSHCSHGRVSLRVPNISLYFKQAY